jgi:hypothetical protein
MAEEAPPPGESEGAAVSGMWDEGEWCDDCPVERRCEGECRTQSVPGRAVVLDTGAPQGPSAGANLLQFLLFLPAECGSVHDSRGRAKRQNLERRNWARRPRYA